MADDNKNFNLSQDRRRAENNLMQDSFGRMSEVMAEGLSIWQKCLSFNAHIAHNFGDMLDSMQGQLEQNINTAQRTIEQARKAS